MCVGMFKNNRSEHTGIIAIGVITFLLIFGMIGYFLGIDQNLDLKHEENAEQAQAEVASNIEGDCFKAGVLSQNCVQDEMERYRVRHDGSENLSAQKSMAYWAKWLLILTAFTTAISMLALAYVARTLEITKATLVATQDMASEQSRIGGKQVQVSIEAVNAAKEANQVAKQSVQEGTRPFVCVEPSVSNFAEWKEGTCQFSWKIRIMNLGRSAATINKVKIKTAVAKDLSSVQEWFERQTSKPNGMGIGLSESVVLLPEQEIVPSIGGFWWRLSGEMQAGILHAEIFLLMEVLVEYDDMYLEPHITKATFRHDFIYYKVATEGGKAANYRT